MCLLKISKLMPTVPPDRNKSASNVPSKFFNGIKSSLSMSLYTKLSSVFHKQKVLANIMNNGVNSSSSQSQGKKSEQVSTTPSASAMNSVVKSSNKASPNPISSSKSCRSSTKATVSGTLTKTGESQPSSQAKNQSQTTSSMSRQRSTSTSNKGRRSQTALRNPSSDDFTNALTLKRRNQGKSCIPQLAPVHKTFPSVQKVSKKVKRDKSTASEKNIAATVGSNNNSTLSKAASVVATVTQTSKALSSSSLATSCSADEPPSRPNSGAMKHEEGPIDLADENFDFHKILARPPSWVDENESKNSIVITAKKKKSINVIRPGSGSSLHFTGPPTALTFQDTELKRLLPLISKENKSENWSPIAPKETPFTRAESVSSGVPSLTSLSAREYKEKAASEQNTSVETDENNNTILGAIKNTIFRSLSIFEIQRGGAPDKVDEASSLGGTANYMGVAAEGNENDADESSLYTVNDQDLDEINNVCPQGISSTSDLPCNYDSDSPAASPTYGVFLQNEDAVLIPLELEERFEKSLKLGKISRHSFHPENRASTQPNPKQSIPSMTKLKIVGPEGNVEYCNLSEVQVVYDDSVFQMEEEKNFDTESKQPSTVHSFTSAVADEDDLQNEEVQDNESFLDANANANFSGDETSTNSMDEEEEQKQTFKPPSRVTFQESRPSTRAGGDIVILEKLKKMVSVNLTKVNIVPPMETMPTPVICTREVVTSRKISPDPPKEKPSVPVPGSLPASYDMNRLTALKSTTEQIRLDPQPSLKDCLKRRQTCTEIDADYGFPSHNSISQFIDNIVQMKWPPNFTLLEESENSENSAKTGKDAGIHSKGSGPSGEEPSLIATAYDILSAGLKYASKIIGDEADLEPREDFIRYNGYKIKVYGKALLLESVHVNREFHVSSKNGACCRSIHSFISLQPHTLSRETLEERSCIDIGGGGRRVRIVIRITGSSAYQAEKAKSIIELKHFVQLADGKWTFFLNQERNGNGVYYGENGDNRGEDDKQNFVEIGCPTGVHPETIEYGLIHGLLYIDAP